ncbi:c-type cytochrome biogenesis protein CcmI [Kordiimonas pumila]|uniref:C-type cytochrome biogenesis protein CcmI n=1 Tax=Kordiimonas pumila TaxID=2161677 RepID=A0ABV7D2T2_9PROT|nr:c-type cytochrome biogenesis protein CcmI [Kordiimonas pumila]
MNPIVLWCLIALLAVFAFWLISFRAHNRTAQNIAADPIEHFKKQLQDLEQDESRGIITPESARSARLEIERRILRVAAKEHDPALVAENSKTVFLGIACGVVAAAFGIYAYLGSPGVEAAPGERISLREAEIQEGGPTFGEAIEKIQQRLQIEPDSIEGLGFLVTLSRSVGDFKETVDALHALTGLQPEETRWRIETLETYLAAGGGSFMPATKLVLDDLLHHAPDHPAGQYYLGLVRLEDGDKEGAKAIWTALADRSSPDAPWMPTLNSRLAELGINPPKLSGDQVAAVNDMSPEERAAFIESMMDRLKARLEETPNDPAGWLMLARSQAATGDKAAATATLQQALRILPAERTADIKAFLDNLAENGNP